MASKPMTAERLAEQKEVVEKAATSKMLNRYAGIMVSGDNFKLIQALTGELKNTHNAVFKKCLGKTCCEHCGAKERLDRAHTTSRPEIAKKVLDEIHPDPDVPIDLKVFMTAFVMEHSNVGVWMLCRKCHKELG